MNTPDRRWARICRFINLGVLAFAAVYFFLYPGAKVLYDITDPNIRDSGIPRSASGFHQALAPKYERWATKRLSSTRAAELSTENISGTEWPLFGSVFFLWATESLQDAWEKEHPATPSPRTYAKGAVEAATRLVIDPQQANWVKVHWGTNYLHKENVFYRMLVISALTSHARITGDKQHLLILRDQVESLARELSDSPHGVLNDYPDECYPGDVLTAIAAIRHADTVLGSDHSAFVQRAIRGFQGEALDERGLVPYHASAEHGKPYGPSRGCGNSYVSLFAPSIWPEPAKDWYAAYIKYFWQEGWACAGFREFPNDMARGNWYMDVDAGPVLNGFGCAACAFGVGAARVNGHLEHAYPLTTELLAASWPLPNGTRLFPRLLSNAADAPYLGEAAILFNLTRVPAGGLATKSGGAIPGFVFIVVALQFVIGLGLLTAALRSGLRLRKACPATPHAKMQLRFWVTLMVCAVGLIAFGLPLVAAIVLLLAQFFPRSRQQSVASVNNAACTVALPKSGLNS